jgi:hypothetical protein
VIQRGQVTKNTAKQDANTCGSIVGEREFAEIWQRKASEQVFVVFDVNQ